MTSACCLTRSQYLERAGADLVHRVRQPSRREGDEPNPSSSKPWLTSNPFSTTERAEIHANPMRTLSGGGKQGLSPPLVRPPGHLPFSVARTLHPQLQGKGQGGKGGGGPCLQTISGFYSQHSTPPERSLEAASSQVQDVSQKASNVSWISSCSSRIKARRSPESSWTQE